MSFRSDPPRASGPADGSQPNDFATLVDDNAAAATQNDRPAQSSPPPAVSRQDNNPNSQPSPRETPGNTDLQSSRRDSGGVAQKPGRDAPESKADSSGKRGKTSAKSDAAKGKTDTASATNTTGTTAPSASQTTPQIQPDATVVAAVVPTSTDTAAAPDTSNSNSSGPLKIAAAAIAASAKVAADASSQAASPETDSTSTVSASDSAAVTEAAAAAANDIAATNFKIAKDIETAPAPVVAKAAVDATETLDAQQKLGVAVANPTDTLVKTTLKASASERHTDPATAATKALNPDSASTAPPSSTAQPANDGTIAQPAAATHPKSSDAEAKPKPDGIDGSASANPTTSAPTEHRIASTSTQPASMQFDPSSQTNALPQPQALPTTAPAVPASQLTAAIATSVAVPLNGLAVQIAATAQSGRSRFEIRLDPAELGRIDVRLDVDRHGQVTSHLVVEKPETLAMLRQDAPQLQRALEDAGLKTGNNGLQFSLRDQSSSGNQNGDNHSNRNTQHLIVGDADSLPAAVVGKSYGPSTGSARGLDIRV